MVYSRFKKAFQVVSTVAFIFSFSACHLFNHSDEKFVLTVGSRNITRTELNKDISGITNEMGLTNEELKQEIKPVVGKIVEKYLIMEYGKEMDIEVTDDDLAESIKDFKKDYPDNVFQELLLKNSIDYDSWKENLYRKLLIEKITEKAIDNTSPITYEEIREYYDAHRDEYRHPLMIRLRQIVVRTMEEAKNMLNRIVAGEDMGALAKKYSITPDAKDNGIMGWVTKGEFEEGIEGTVFSLPKGKRSDIIKSSYGYHIFEVIDVRSEGAKTLPEVMKEIETKLTLQKRELSYIKWISDLRNRYPVKIEEDIYTSWNKEG
jgi:peptidyl-prolyl cis-trans isomerase C